MPDSNDHDRNFGVKLEYDKDFKGPRSKRSCTDVICLLLFVAFLAGWGFVGFFAYQYGDFNRILVPTDSQGLQCGVDSQVIDKPYLLFFDLQKCIDPLVPIHGCPTPQVCVAQCPQTTFVFDSDRCTPMELPRIKQQLICARNVNVGQIASCSDVDELISSDRCAKWYLRSDSLSRRCIPFNWTADDLQLINLSETKLFQAVENLALLANINGEGQKIIEDIVSAAIPIGLAMLAAMLCCLIVITMMRWVAAPLLWLSVIGVIGLLIAGIYFCQERYRYYVSNPPLRPEAGTNLQAIFNNYLTSKNTWLVLLITVSVLLVVILLVLLVLRKRIQIAIALVKEGSKAVSSAYATVFFPIFPWILQLATIAFAVSVGMLLLSVGQQQFQVVGLSSESNCHCSGPAAKYADGSPCDPKTFHDNCRTSASTSQSLLRLLGSEETSSNCAKAACFFRTIEQPPVVPWFHLVNVVGFFWVLFFISALGEMVLAAVFATWFWSFNKSNVPFFTITRSLGRTIRYHLGTLAFGSLLLTICRLIRVVLAFIQRKLKQYDNVVTRGILCCMQCFFWCLEKFLMFLNKNAYIMCAIHGTNFCSSAKDAFELLMRNVLRVFALDQVTAFLFFMAKLLVSLGMAACTYLFLTSQHSQVQLNYVFVPPIIVAIGTYLISSVFFSVYSMAVDTLFLCFLEDSERNDGSRDKPYYMSKNLMRILGERNDVSREHYYTE